MWFRQKADKVTYFPPTFFLLELFDLVVEKSYFQFDQDFYFQICDRKLCSALSGKSFHGSLGI